MRKLLLAATAALSFAVPAAAATTYNFSLTGTYNAAWSLPASRTTDFNFGFLGGISNVTFTVPGNATQVVDLFIFDNSFGGGIQVRDNLVTFSDLYRGRGDVIWTGAIEAPVFKTGSFTLTDAGGATNGTLTISAVNAVPEPASWAMLIAGFGLTGAAMRRRRTSAVAA